MTPENLVIYLAFGDKCIAQAIYSLLTLVDVYGGHLNLKVKVYTDQPDRFSWFVERYRVETVPISAATMAEWHGPMKQPLRAKIRVFQEALDHHAGNILLLDSDTLVRKPLTSLFQAMTDGAIVMHRREYPLAQARKLNVGLCPEDFSLTLSNGQTVSVNDQSVMWNSGVIGLRSVSGALIDRALELNDLMYAKYPAWHIEQLSYSLILASRGKLRGCPSYIFHYWSNKEIIEPYLAACRARADEISDERLREVRRLKYIHMAKVSFKYHSRRIKEGFRDLPGVYSAYRLLISPFKKSNPVVR